MIPFFRKIRMWSLSQSKFGKYLLYATGEIVLVVIGILIALQINNWNNIQKDRAEERVLLQNLREEFVKNLDELEWDHGINVRTVKAAHFILETDLTTKTPREIDSLVGRMVEYATFDPSIGYIEQMISSGKLDLIQNDSLKIYLSQWSGQLNDMNEDVIIRRDHWLNHLLPTVRKHIPIRNTDQFQDRLDFSRQLQVTPRYFNDARYLEFALSNEVDGAIYDFYLNQYYVVISEEQIEKHIHRILNLIETELEDHRTGAHL